MDLVDIVIAALAGSQLIEYWRHGQLFDPPARPFALLKALRRLRDSSQTAWPLRKLAKLLTCPFCLTPWAVGLCWLLLVISRQPGVSPAAVLLLQCVPAVLAGSRLAQAGHGFLHPYLRSPRLPDNQAPSQELYPWEILNGPGPETSQSLDDSPYPEDWPDASGPASRTPTGP